MQRIEHSIVGFQPLAPVFPLPQLTAAASASCRLKSAAGIDREGVPVADHTEESPRLTNARVCSEKP